jgi:hypothetical protein
MEMVLPRNYVEINQDEAMVLDGGNPALIPLLLAWGASPWVACRAAGEYAYNQGWARNGAMKTAFRAAAAGIWGGYGLVVFEIQFDNGWVAASKV